MCRVSRTRDEERQLAQAISDWPVQRPRHWTRLVNQPQTQAELEALQISVERGDRMATNRGSDRPPAA
jgi:hypothetical protein